MFSLRTLLIIGWICLGIEVLILAAVLITRNSGTDAAGRGLSTGVGLVMTPIVLALGGLLWWGMRTESRSLILTGSLLATLPFLVMLGLFAQGMVQKGARAVVQSGEGSFASAQLTALAREIDRGDTTQLVTLLRGAKLDYTIRDKFNRTLLGHAIVKARANNAAEANVSAVRILLENGVPFSVDAVEPNTDWVATITADASDQQLKLLEIGLTHGANPNATDESEPGQPLLFNTNMTVAKAELLIKHGADIQRRAERRDRNGWSVLMSAVFEKRWEMARFFLAAGVDPNHVTADGQSVHTLLDAADATARSMGDTPDEQSVEFRALLKR